MSTRGMATIEAKGHDEECVHPQVTYDGVQA